MQLNITGHHVEITEPLKAYVEEKMQRLTRKFNNITSAHVILTVEKLVQKAEANVNLAKGDIHAHSEDKDMYAAIDAMIDKLDRQVVKHKEKLNDHNDREV